MPQQQSRAPRPMMQSELSTITERTERSEEESSMTRPSASGSAGFPSALSQLTEPSGGYMSGESARHCLDPPSVVRQHALDNDAFDERDEEAYYEHNNSDDNLDHGNSADDRSQYRMKDGRLNPDEFHRRHLGATARATQLSTLNENDIFGGEPPSNNFVGRFMATLHHHHHVNNATPQELAASSEAEERPRKRRCLLLFTISLASFVIVATLTAAIVGVSKTHTNGSSVEDIKAPTTADDNDRPSIAPTLAPATGLRISPAPSRFRLDPKAPTHAPSTKQTLEPTPFLTEWDPIIVEERVSVSGTQYETAPMPSDINDGEIDGVRSQRYVVSWEAVVTGNCIGSTPSVTVMCQNGGTATLLNGLDVCRRTSNPETVWCRRQPEQGYVALSCTGPHQSQLNIHVRVGSATNTCTSMSNTYYTAVTAARYDQDNLYFQYKCLGPFLGSLSGHDRRIAYCAGSFESCSNESLVGEQNCSLEYKGARISTFYRQEDEHCRDDWYCSSDTCVNSVCQG